MKNVLYIDKPAGMTSFDVCFKLRKVLNTKKIGHTGTLDPNATGVMIVLFDKATKAGQFLVSDSKEYETRVLFGIETDTLDIDGNILRKQEYLLPDKQQISNVLQSFLGESMQTVPLTSAVKVEGKRLYQYQHENKEVELPQRKICVDEIELLEMFEDGFSFRCRVSSGTYIRSLVRDILAELGICGTVSQLRRTAIDTIKVDQCDTLQEVLDGNYRLHDLKEILERRYPVYETERPEDIRNGKAIFIDCKEEMIMITYKGEILAIYRKDNNCYRCVRGLF